MQVAAPATWPAACADLSVCRKPWSVSEGAYLAFNDCSCGEIQLAVLTDGNEVWDGVYVVC